MLIALLGLVAAVAIVGVLIEVPKIRTNHIKAPSERQRRERAARRTLALMIAGVLAVVAVLWVVF